MDLKPLFKGRCNGCFAFAAVSAVESFHFRTSYADFGELLVLSEQNLIDCAYKFRRDEIGRCFRETAPTFGGNPFSVNFSLTLKATQIDLGVGGNPKRHGWLIQTKCTRGVAIKLLLKKNHAESKFPIHLLKFSLKIHWQIRIDKNLDIWKIFVGCFCF